MNPLKNFEDYVETGVVKKQAPQLARAKSIFLEAQRKKSTLSEMLEKIGLREDNANDFIEKAYDIIIELIRAELLKKGFNSLGSFAHESEVSFMKHLGFGEFEINFMNSIRYSRNGIKYYGKTFDKEYAEKVLFFLDKIYPALTKLCLYKL